MQGKVDPKGDPASVSAHKDEPQTEQVYGKTHSSGRSVQNGIYQKADLLQDAPLHRLCAPRHCAL